MHSIRFTQKEITMKFVTGILVLSGLASLSSCINTQNDCAKVMCTMDFRMITVQLKDSLGNPFMPDKVQTFHANGGTLIHEETSSPMPEQDVYTVADDGDLSDFTREKVTPVVFKVIKNNKTIKEANFELKTDCCHISKVSGPDELVVSE